MTATRTKSRICETVPKVVFAPFPVPEVVFAPRTKGRFSHPSSVLTRTKGRFCTRTGSRFSRPPSVPKVAFLPAPQTPFFPLPFPSAGATVPKVVHLFPPLRRLFPVPKVVFPTHLPLAFGRPSLHPPSYQKALYPVPNDAQTVPNDALYRTKRRFILSTIPPKPAVLSHFPCGKLPL